MRFNKFRRPFIGPGTADHRGPKNNSRRWSFTKKESNPTSVSREHSGTDLQHSYLTPQLFLCGLDAAQPESSTSFKQLFMTQSLESDSITGVSLFMGPWTHYCRYYCPPTRSTTSELQHLHLPPSSRRSTSIFKFFKASSPTTSEYFSPATYDQLKRSPLATSPADSSSSSSDEMAIVMYVFPFPRRTHVRNHD